MKDSFSPKSSYIELAEFDDKANALDLTFKDGSKRRYNGFFESTWKNFKQAASHGAYYSHLIKGKFNSVPLIIKNIGRKPQHLKDLNHVKRESGNYRRKAGITGARGTVQRALERAEGRKGAA